MMNDISPLFRWNQYDASIAGGITVLENNSAQALSFFCNNHSNLSNYAYWFFLSTLWVKDADAAKLETWKELFSSPRSKRKKSIMKPSEVQAYDRLPYAVTAYRAHRTEETDWIAYTIDKAVARRFANIHGTREINEYRIKKCDILALFLRRTESEIIVLNRNRTEFIKTIKWRDT